MKIQIKKGKIESFGKLLNHSDVNGIIRYALLESNDFHNNGFHIACHIVNNTYYDHSQDFSKKHIHEFDEINIIIPHNDSLIYEFVLDNKKVILEAPCTVLIPKGKIHSAKPLSGEGIFICIHLNQKK